MKNAGPTHVSTNASMSSEGEGKKRAGATVAQMPQITIRMSGRPIAYAVFSPILAHTREGLRGVTTVLV